MTGLRNYGDEATNPIPLLPNTHLDDALVDVQVTGGSATTLHDYLNVLTSSSGSSLVGTIAAGTGAVARTVSAALGAIVRSGDFDTSGHYDTARIALTESIGVYKLDIEGDLRQAQGVRSVWGSSTLPTLPTRHQWFSKNSAGTWFEAFAVDDNGLADGNVVAVVPKFLSMGRVGVSGTIEFGPTAGAEAIILGSGNPNYHLLYRVSKQTGSAHIFGIHTTGGAFQIGRSNDNFVSNSQTLLSFRSTGVCELWKQAGLSPTLRFIATDGTTTEGNLFHDGNLRLMGSVGALVIETATTANIAINPNNTARWFFDGTNGHLFANTDNQVDIGASGATRPRTGYFATSIVAPVVSIPTGGSTTISTGVGSVKMSSVNAANNAAWIPVTYAGTVYYVPGWTTNSP